jgi:hypothetical protein
VVEQGVATFKGIVASNPVITANCKLRNVNLRFIG